MYLRFDHSDYLTIANKKAANIYEHLTWTIIRVREVAVTVSGKACWGNCLNVVQHNVINCYGTMF